MNMPDRYHIPTAKDIMTKEVVTVSPDLMLGEVVQIFIRRKVSAAPVVSSDNKVIGFISEMDLMNVLANESFHYEESPETYPSTVASEMITKVISINPELDIFELVKFFSENNMRLAPVLDDDQTLLGVISRRDILEALGSLINKTNEIADASKSNEFSYWKEKLLIIDGKYGC